MARHSRMAKRRMIISIMSKMKTVNRKKMILESPGWQELIKKWEELQETKA